MTGRVRRRALGVSSVTEPAPASPACRSSRWRSSRCRSSRWPFGSTCTNSNPKRPFTHRLPSVTAESAGESTFTMRLSWTCSWSVQPTPQYGQIVSVTVWADSSQVPACAQLVLGAEHQRARRADVDAVAAEDAGALGQRDVVLGGDPGVEPAPGDRDRERVLGVHAARLDALVAEDAAPVVADEEALSTLTGWATVSAADPSGAWWWPGVAGVALAGDGRGCRAARTATDPRRTAPCTRRWSRPAARDRRGPRPPTSPAAPGRACASGGPSRSRSRRPCPARPSREQDGVAPGRPCRPRTGGRRPRARPSRRSTAWGCRCPGRGRPAGSWCRPRP